MKAKRWMRYLAMALTLALVMTTPLQASEYISEDTTEAVLAVAPADEDAGDEILSGEEALPTETDPAEAIFAEGAAPVAEISEDGPVEVTNIAEIASNSAEAATIGTTSAAFRTGVWLHVVNGNFSGSYKVEKVEAAVSEGGTEDRYIVEPGDGSPIEKSGEDVKDISSESSIWVRAQGLNRLPKNVENIKVVRSNGTFDGWYTEAPTEELQSKDGYSVWHTVHTNGDKIEPGAAIPEGVHVLYAAFKDKNEEEVESKEDKLVTFYLDWNGINGQFGHCLTCTRSYDEGNAKFTAEDAAVYGLNYGYKYHDRKNKGSQKGYDEAQAKEAEEALQKENEELAKKYGSDGDYCLEGKENEEKWSALEKLWAEATFNGYKFLGWSTERHNGEIIKKDTPITNGMSLYAQWEKESGESSDTFEAVDPAAGSLEFIRIVAGDGTTFTSGTLSASTHGVKGASLTLNLFCTPVRAELKDVTWTLKITEGLNDGDHLADLFTKKEKTVVISTAADETDGSKELPDCLKVEATGNKLTITSQSDKTCCSIVVSAEATGAEDGKAETRASATLCFNHSWEEVQEEDPTCMRGGKICYTCTECKAKEIKTTAPLGHFYKTGVENKPGQEYYEVVKLPTCTTAGTKQYICQRCGETNGGTASIPATGHCWGDWEVTKEPTVSETGLKTRSCEHCGEQETEILPQLVAASQDSQPGNDEVDEDDPVDNSVPTPEVKQEDDTQNNTTENNSTQDEAKTDDAVQTDSETVNPAPKVTPVNYAVNSVTKTVSADKSTTAKSGWQKVGKKKYYYVNGVKQTGWKKIGKKKYYFGKNGVMQTGWKTIGKKKYYFGKNGVMRTGKQKIGKKIYIFGKNGALKK